MFSSCVNTLRHHWDSWLGFDKELLTPTYNVLNIYCTCLCVRVWLHGRISVFECSVFARDWIEEKLFLFYLIYLWFPLSEILISTINQPRAIEGKRNSHTHDTGNCGCVCLSEFPDVLALVVCVCSLQCALIIGAFASLWWISCIGSPVLRMPESLKHKNTSSRYDHTLMCLHTHR